MKTELEQDMQNDAKGRWKEDVYTRHLRTQVDKLIAIKLATLIGKCASSSDAAVQKALGEYETVRALKKTLETGET